MPSELPFVAILRGVTPDEVLVHASVISAQGFEAIEVPANSPDWQASVRLLAENYGDALPVGAGTILSTADVDALAATGAKLMVTPNTEPAVVRHAKQKGLRAIVGCMTPSEALAAVAAGADGLKIFPASVVGPRFARILQAVLPRQVPLYAVGGVTPANLSEYADLGWAGFGLGGELYRPGQSAGDTDAKAAAFRDAWRALTR